jgi:lysophospholipase L1-like esterase
MLTERSNRTDDIRSVGFCLTLGIASCGMLLGAAEGGEVVSSTTKAESEMAAVASRVMPVGPGVANTEPSPAARRRGNAVESVVSGSYDRPLDAGRTTARNENQRTLLAFGSGDRTAWNVPVDDIANVEDEVASSLRPAELIEIAASRAKNNSAAKPSGFTILQIGDSHTAADYFTGEVRKILQARYGNGGAGYVDVGRPHPGVRSDVLKVSVSSGWSYTALQKSNESNLFFLSGFDATATRSGESLTFTAAQAVPYDQIEIEVATGPDYGAIDIVMDNLPPVRRSLAMPENGRLVFRITPENRKTDKVHRLVITTLDDRPTTISSIGIFNKGRGLSYSNVGFPGATIDIVNKYDPKMLDDELKRLAPQIVVLAFGTNEGFNDDLDLEHYRSRYRSVIGKIRRSLPHVQIVMVGPPHADRVTSICIKDPQSAACKAARGEAESDQPKDCPYPTPPRLDPVRQIQRDLAKQENIPFWDWSGIMPARCGAHTWVMANPRLMASDHVHFTPEGYKVSANAFAAFLSPIVNQLRRQQYALSDD